MVLELDLGFKHNYVPQKNYFIFEITFNTFKVATTKFP
jgi:hypothetical protein